MEKNEPIEKVAGSVVKQLFWSCKIVIKPRCFFKESKE